MTLHYNDGNNSRYGISLAAALDQIASKYGMNADDLVTSEDDARILVWLDEESAADDPGLNAVAEIIKPSQK